MVVSHISEVTALVSWTPLTLVEARGFITDYEISYWTVGSDGLDIMSIQVSGDSNSTLITRLDPRSEYYITVSVSTIVGKSNISTPIVLSHYRPITDENETGLGIMCMICHVTGRPGLRGFFQPIISF